LTAPADAQTAQETDGGTEDIVVTGTITRATVGLLGDQPIQDTPFAVSGITDELMRDQFARTLKDAVAFDPSVQQGNAPGSQFEQFNIRGLPLLAVETAFNGLYGLAGGRRANLAGAARVEIFKGPNALLNGISPFGALGGTMNIVPKRAQRGQDQIAGLSFRSRSTIDGYASIGTRTSDDSFGVQVSAQAADGETMIRSNDLFDFSANIALDVRSGGFSATLDLGHDYSRYKQPDVLLAVAAGVAIPEPPNLSDSLTQPWANYRVESQRALLGLKYEFNDDWSVSARIGRGYAFETYDQPSSVRIDTTAGAYSFNRLKGGGADFTTSGDIGLNGRFDTGGLSHAIAINATSFDQRSEGNSIATAQRFNSNIFAPVTLAAPPLGPMPAFIPSGEREFRTVAIADTIGAFDDRLLLTLGARYQEIDVWNYANGARTTNIKQSRTTPTVALLWKASDALSIYANYAQSLAIGPLAPGGSANSGTVFPPIVATSYEAGAKYSARGLTGTLALFRTNNQVGFVDPATNIFGINGDVVITGVEASVSGTILPGWRLIGGATYLDTAQRGTAGGLTDGNRSVGVPDLSVSLYSTLDVPGIDGLSINGRAIYQSQQFRDAANTQFIPGWTRFDAGVKYTFGDAPSFVLRLNVENLADKRYWQSLTRGNLAKAAPRTVLASLDMLF
jgi:iron complex outermembrane receptor protein